MPTPIDVHSTETEMNQTSLCAATLSSSFPLWGIPGCFQRWWDMKFLQFVGRLLRSPMSWTCLKYIVIEVSKRHSDQMPEPPELLSISAPSHWKELLHPVPMNSWPQLRPGKFVDRPINVFTMTVQDNGCIMWSQAPFSPHCWVR